MPEKKTTGEGTKRRSRAQKAEPEAPEPEPLLKDRRFVGALVVLAVVFLFGAGYVVGHAAGESDATSNGVVVPGGGDRVPADLGGFIGVVGRGVDDGALILEVIPGSPADQAGLRRGDVVVGFDDHHVLSMEALAAMVRSSQPGSTIELTVQRGDRTRTFDVHVIARPDHLDRPGRILPRPPG